MAYEFTLYQHQFDAINSVKSFDKVAFYLECGLGKTLCAMVMSAYYGDKKVLIVCPKSLIPSWKSELKKFLDVECTDLTKKLIDYEGFGIINYDLMYRREELLNWSDYTLIFDESSKLCHDNTRTTKFALKMKPKHLILLSGSPSLGGKYELLYAQAKLLGVETNKSQWWNNYVRFVLKDFSGCGHARIPVITGYHNVNDMIEVLRQHGAVFVKAKDVFDMPSRVETEIPIDAIPEFKRFLKDRVVTIDGEEFVGDTTLTKRLRARQLSASYNTNKLNRMTEMLEEMPERVIIFYVFKRDCEKLKEICAKLNRHVSVVSGDERDLDNYEKYDDTVTLIQYASGSYGLNLEKCNKIVHFSLTESADQFIQSEARIMRVTQKQTCWYYYMIGSSLEKQILKTLKRGEDYSDKLFEMYLSGGDF